MRERLGQRVEVAVRRRSVRSASARACSSERLRIRTGPTPRRRRCFTASAAIWPAPTTTTSRPSRPPSASAARSAPQRDEGVGRGAERRLLADPAPGARRGVEQPGQARPGGALALGAAERLAHLRVDLRLAQHHRVEPRRDREQVVGGVLLPVGVERLGQLVGVDAAGLGEQPLQRQEAGVVARDARRDLDPVARGQDHGLVDAVLVEHAAVGLREVVVGEREPLEQLDRRATEGDPEGQEA